VERWLVVELLCQDRVVTTRAAGRQGATTGGRQLLSKVPEVTAAFWILKLLTTAGGESIADLLASDAVLGMKPALVVTGSLLLVVLLVQLSVRRYLVPIYWAAVALVGIAGTLITDYIVRWMGVGAMRATVGFVVALLATFVVWHVVERTLSIHSIHTTRRELFYWSAVLLTFALGTAAGDLTAFTLGWGFLPSIALYAVVFVAARVAHLRFGVNAILCFWVAYVVTRPLGATIADYLAFGHQLGGLALGLGAVSLGFGLAIACGVGYLTVTRRETHQAREAAGWAR
jgi:uncharacterized membrane-anchored protein